MATEAWHTATIESLLKDGTIVAHKDGNFGSSYPRGHEFGNEGVPFLTAKLLDDSGHIAIREAPRLAFDKASQLTYGFVETDDVLISHNATIGRVAIVPELSERVLIGTSLTYYRVNPKRLLPRYLAAYFKGRDFQNQLKAVMSHSTRNQVPITAQRTLTIVVPPLAEQRRIADILGTLDDKIELNRRMNETLEAMARRLFKSWFVDFDPVHAKAAVRNQHQTWSNAQLSRAALSNMSPEIAELFPDSFEDSLLGPIPTGWKCGPVPEAIDVNPMCSLAKGTVAPYLEMSNMPTRSARASEWVERAFTSGTKFTNGDTLVARITPCLENGKTAYVDFLNDGQVGWGSTEYIILRPRAPLPPKFGYFLARTEDFRQHLIMNMTGTSGRQRAPADCLIKYLVVTPPEPIAQSFGITAESFLWQMKRDDENTKFLAVTRDTLLPTLLSGSSMARLNKPSNDAP